MKVPYASLRMHFPDTDSVEREELYHWIGYPENINNPNFYNTCAIRMSLALLGAGYPNPGSWPIKGRQVQGTLDRNPAAQIERVASTPCWTA